VVIKIATFSYIADRESAILQLIEAVKIERAKNTDTNKVNKENYEIWYSVKENAEILLNELKQAGIG
jgi:hypothetical protein